MIKSLDSIHALSSDEQFIIDIQRPMKAAMLKAYEETQDFLSACKKARVSKEQVKMWLQWDQMFRWNMRKRGFEVRFEKPALSTSSSEDKRRLVNNARRLFQL